MWYLYFYFVHDRSLDKNFGIISKSKHIFLVVSTFLKSISQNGNLSQIVRHWEDGGVQIPIGFFLVSVGARPRGAKCFLTRKNGVGNQKICKIYPGDSAGDFLGWLSM